MKGKGKVISFSAVEILPGLLNWKFVNETQNIIGPPKLPFPDYPIKTQTIRPLKNISDWNDTVLKRVKYGKPRFKVGDKIQLMWKQRSKAKTFCFVCGKGIVEGSFSCHCKRNIENELWFNKLLGTTQITECFEIEMQKSKPDGEPIIIKKRLPESPDYYFDAVEISELAKRDGFANKYQFVDWFDNHYHLSVPKRFQVRRWA